MRKYLRHGHEFEAGRRSLTQDYQYREEDGSIKWAEAVVTLTGKPHSSNIIAFVTVRDVTEEKMLDMTMVSMDGLYIVRYTGDDK